MSLPSTRKSAMMNIVTTMLCAVAIGNFNSNIIGVNGQVSFGGFFKVGDEQNNGDEEQVSGRIVVDHDEPQPVAPPTYGDDYFFPEPNPKPTVPKMPTPYSNKRPTLKPKPTPNAKPIEHPTPRPSERPTPLPTPRPTPEPTPYPRLPPPPRTKRPTDRPTPLPTPRPTPLPTPHPTSNPTPRPTQKTPGPTPNPTPDPTPVPTPNPTLPPTPSPTKEPSPEPSTVPTDNPSADPTPAPSPEPTEEPTVEPTDVPTSASEMPSETPTGSEEPSENPTNSEEPSETPSLSLEPTESPSVSAYPSMAPVETVLFTITGIVCNPDNAMYFSTLCNILEQLPALANALDDDARRRLEGDRILEEDVSANFTMFAPTNKAFERAEFPIEIDFNNTSFSKLQKDVLRRVLQTHVVGNNMVKSFDDLVCDHKLRALSGEQVQIRCIYNLNMVEQKFLVGETSPGFDADVVIVAKTDPKIVIRNSDIDAINGILHSINNVIIPRLEFIN